MPRRMLDRPLAAMMIIDHTGCIVSCNPQGLALLGYSYPLQVIGRDISFVMPYGSEDDPLRKCARKGAPEPVTAEHFFHEEGSLVSVLYRSDPVWLENGLRGAMCTFAAAPKGCK